MSESIQMPIFSIDIHAAYDVPQSCVWVSGWLIKMASVGAVKSSKINLYTSIFFFFMFSTCDSISTDK